jgi:hypothetical protein
MEIIISILIGVLIMEGYAWLDAVSKWLLERAVRQISPEDQDRCREEWRADLDAMPNTVVKLIYAWKNFSTDVADKINADCYEAMLNRSNEMFDNIIDAHRRCCERFEVLKLVHSNSLSSQEELRHSLAQGALELTTREQRISNPQAAESAHGVVVAYKDWAKTAVQLAGRSSDLLGGRIERMGTKLSRVESLLKSVSEKRERRNELTKKGSLFSVEVDRTNAEINQDLTELLLALEDGNDIDASAMQEHEEIFAAIGRLVQRDS